MQNNILAALLVLSGHIAAGQVQIKGTIYDRSLRFALPGVSVMATSGGGTATDSLGHYSIRLFSGDSIYFSYLGRFTARFPVKNLSPNQPFDMSLQVAIDSLPSVYVRPKDYRMDSLENREEYRKIFDYGGPDYINNMKVGKGGRMGVGLDFDMLFQGRQIRRMEAFQRRLQEEERDRYVDHRFTKSLVKRITGLQPPALDTFMRQYRPSYEFIQGCENEYEYYKYIYDWGKYFSELWKRDHPDGSQ
ncbi:MAG TPA: hypothetical protein VNS58_15300 [Puia sp.]|nr:hypothetical protein [Puia sp.]